MVDNKQTGGFLLLLKQGNSRAFSELYNMFYKALVARAHNMLGSEAEAEDVVQVFFIEFWQKRLYMQVHTSLQAYMQAAVYNKCIKLVAQRKKVRAMLEGYTRHTCCDAVPALYKQQQTEEKVQALINNLPPRRLEVLKLVCLQNKKYAEAAEILGISVNSVKTHLRLAFKFLKSDDKKRSPF